MTLLPRVDPTAVEVCVWDPHKEWIFQGVRTCWAGHGVQGEEVCALACLWR